MKRTLILFLLVAVQLQIVHAQTDTTEYCSYCITQAIGISAGGGKAGYNLGVTAWILHAELNVGRDTRVPGGSNRQYDMSTYIGSTGVILRLVQGLGLQLGFDHMQEKSYKRWSTSREEIYYDLAFRRNTRTISTWHSKVVHEESYISPYMGIQYNVLGNTWICFTHGFDRGSYFSVELTF